MTAASHRLILHPDNSCAAVESIQAHVTRSSPAGLTLRYLLTGDTRGLLLPLPVGPVCTDELWRHSCFELFLRAGGEDAYCEFNFSPSLQWAAYRFDVYRQGMRPLEIHPPRMEIRQDTGSFELRAELDLDALPDAEKLTDWRLGLSAIVEETDGRISYWALAHPAGKPDFHHEDGFTISFPAFGI